MEEKDIGEYFIEGVPASKLMFEKRKESDLNCFGKAFVQVRGLKLNLLDPLEMVVETKKGDTK